VAVKTGKYRGWTEEELEYLDYNYGMKSLKEIADYLGRSVASVDSRVYRDKLKIKGQLEYAIYYDDKHKFMGNQDECAEFLGVSADRFQQYKAPSYASKSETGIRIVDLGRWRIDEDE